MNYPEIVQRVFHAPLLAAPAKAAAFVKGLGPRLLSADQVQIGGVDAGSDPKPSAKPYASLLDERLGGEIRAGRRDAFRMLDGVAVIPITGTLIHRGAWIGSYSGETSYEGIAAQIDAALENRSVRAIALEIDSHGGEVAGCFDLADRIRKANEQKPVWSFVCDYAFSAAYALASQAEHVVMPRAGGVGSIGVICLHADFSTQLKEMGVQVTVISAGEHKADGNPYEPLPDDVRDSLKAEMETLRQIFADTVGEGRGEAFDAQAALDTQARCFIGADAVEQGLADEVANPREAFERFVAQINGQQFNLPGMEANRGKYPMNTKSKKDQNAETEDTTPEDENQETEEQQAEVQGNEQEPDKDKEMASASKSNSSPAPSASDERKRIAAIMNCDEAAGREDLAKSLAFNSDMSAEEAKVHLAAAPKTSSKGSLSENMDQDETDLDMPAGANAPENPVKAAQKKRWN
ncbi:S49 family peptidase [Ruegeria arenilitoris]|uniref:S49 family peptidase n=1 Tax=Ruegeria arenilitoris TaxID=1173585 RepID=UPI001480771C|nr:S49 family peptidase [Ruegeria arenilitoris]